MFLLSDAQHRNLQASLPPLGDWSPQAEAARMESALARLVSLAPADEQEISLAIVHIAAGQQAIECLYIANTRDTAPNRAYQCRAQANAMMRQASAALRQLQATQRSRGVRFSRPPPEAPPEPPAEPAATPTPAPPAMPDLKPIRAAITAAEDFARRFPNRAARIRRARGVPEGINYEVPHPAVVDALVFGMTKPLRRLDRIPNYILDEVCLNSYSWPETTIWRHSYVWDHRPHQSYLPRRK
jgi:hypothetical protein